MLDTLAFDGERHLRSRLRIVRKTMNENVYEVLAATDGLIERANEQADPKREDFVQRLTAREHASTPLRISAEIRTEGVRGVPGSDCSVFCNLEYGSAPVFWDTFLYPDTGSTPWRRLTCDCLARGQLTAVELHVRNRRQGRLLVRNFRVETLPCWDREADVTIAIFGDSTDMTCYLPHEHRLTRRLELLLRDRFTDQRINVHGLAEGGEFIHRLVDSGRLDRELAALGRCDIVLFRYGLNDVHQNVTDEAFQAKLREAIDHVRSSHPQARIVLCTTIPYTCDGYDARVRQLAAKLDLPLIDLHAVLVRRSAAGDWDWHHDPQHHIGRHREQLPPGTLDGLQGDKHPNLHGATMIAETYFEHLEPLVEELIRP